MESSPKASVAVAAVAARQESRLIRLAGVEDKAALAAL
jgi:hypothetical protein